MGLDFSHCEARWAYSGFMKFRVKLAAEAGIALHCMEGFACGPSGEFFKSLVIAGDSGERGRMPGFDKYIGHQSVISWDKCNDPIKPLLNHSDCNGILTPEECLTVAPRLRELISQWAEDDQDKIRALLLAEGMERAAEANENLELC